MITIDNTMSVVEQMEAVLGKPEPETAETDQTAGEEVKAPKEDPEQEPEVDDEAGEEEDAEPVVKKKGGWQRKLVRKDQEIAQLRAMLEAQNAGTTGAERESHLTIEGKPTLDQFDGDLEKFTEALVDWREASNAAKAKAKHQAETWETRTAEAEKEISDFADYSDVTIPLTQQMREFIVDSAIGPKLGYTLAKDITEAQRIYGLPPLQQVRALAKLELELTGPTTPPVKQVTKASAAPPPIKPLSGATSSQVVKDPSKMNFQEWNAWRNSGGK